MPMACNQLSPSWGAAPLDLHVRLPAAHVLQDEPHIMRKD